MSYRAIGLAMMLVSAGAASGVASATQPAGADLADACTACHGPGGHARGAIPSLAGMDIRAFVQRMQAYKGGEGTIMNRIAPAYDAAQIAALAAYFGARDTIDNEGRDAPQ